MKKEMTAIVLCLVSLLSLTGCDKAISNEEGEKQAQAIKDKEDAEDFKIPAKGTLIYDYKTPNGKYHSEIRLDRDNYYFYDYQTEKDVLRYEDGSGWTKVPDIETKDLSYVDGASLIHIYVGEDGTPRNDSHEYPSTEKAKAEFDYKMDNGTFNPILAEAHSMIGVPLFYIQCLDSGDKTDVHFKSVLGGEITKVSYSSSGEGNLTITFSGSVNMTVDSRYGDYDFNEVYHFENYLFSSFHTAAGSSTMDQKMNWNSCTITKDIGAKS
ncbi:MAG: hypothetical protein LKJ88_01630 [Bacilli bacterium]|jgi:hypothetical protein|nr:hypothetical protein [Bacilli bacterium]